VELDSTVGVGSTFTAIVPVVFEPAIAKPEWDLDASRTPILVVEDSLETILLYEKMLAAERFQVLGARTLRDARNGLKAFRPGAIVLDIGLKGEDTWTFLTEVKRHPDLHDVPIVVVTNVEDERKALALGADAYWRKPIDRQRLVQTITRLVEPEAIKRVLVVDDEEVFRYVLRQHLMTPRHVVSEAATGNDALRLARTERPDVICLDLGMPDTDGAEILRLLKSDPDTRDIPVVIVTAKPLNQDETATLRKLAVDVIAKNSVSRERALEAVDAAMRIGGKAE